MKKFYSLKMMIYGLLLFTCLTYVAHGTRCVSETLKCTKLYRNFNTHRDLPATPTALNKECRLQERFFTCLRNISPDGFTERYDFPLPDDFEKMEDTLGQLCTEGSELRKRYLVGAYCINKQETSHCTSRVYLGGDLETEESPAARCMFTMRSRYCIDTIIKDNCGLDASFLFKELTHAFQPDDDCLEDYDEEVSSLEYDSTEATTRRDDYQARSRYLRDLRSVIESTTQNECSECKMSSEESQAEYKQASLPGEEATTLSASLDLTQGASDVPEGAFNKADQSKGSRESLEQLPDSHTAEGRVGL